MTELEITDTQTPMALVIPTSCILRSTQQEDFVYVARMQKNKSYLLQKVPVEVLQTSGGEAHIRSIDHELVAGDLIVAKGIYGIREGEAVRTH